MPDLKQLARDFQSFGALIFFSIDEHILQFGDRLRRGFAHRATTPLEYRP